MHVIFTCYGLHYAALCVGRSLKHAPTVTYADWRPFISIHSHTWYQLFRARSPANSSELLTDSCDLYFCKPSQESALVALQWSNQERCKPRHALITTLRISMEMKRRPIAGSTAVLSSSANKGGLSGFIIVQLRCSRAALLVLIRC